MISNDYLDCLKPTTILMGNCASLLQSGGWSLKTGGIMPANTSAKDRERDRDGEDVSVAKGLESAFTGLLFVVHQYNYML